MRTTLKRIGAGGSLNGDSGSDPPRGPRVGPLSPRSWHTVKRRGVLGLAVRVLAGVAIAAAVAAGGLAGGVWLFLADAVEAIQPTDPDVIEAKVDLADLPSASEPTTALIIGFDKRQGVDASDEARSDTIMLARADPNTDTLSLLSFPRDMLVDHPGCKARGPWRGKINEAYTSCKASGTLRTVKQLTGLEINYLITVNFRAFRQIVDQVGGVLIDVDQRYFNDRSGPGGFATIDLQPGYQRLNGLQALDYARFRHTDNDIFRTLRQQTFVKAFKQRVESAISPLRLPSLIKAVTENVQVQQGGRKDIDPNTVLRYARFLYELPSGAFTQVKLDADAFTETGDQDLLVSDDDLREALTDFASPDAEAPAKAADAATGKRPKAPKPAETTITVLNGNGSAGAAADAAQRLRERAYQAESGGDADSFDYFETVVHYRPGIKREEAAAEAVAILFDGRAEEAPAGVGFDTMLQVVVGSTFRGTIAPGAVDHTPDRQEAAIVERTDDILQLIAEAQPRVSFPILVPEVRQKDSILVPEQAMRVYKIDGKDAVKMVFRWGQFKYWGIQQTAMTDAPILKGASLTRKIKGREYDLYFSGPRLIMVAFEENGAAYWVTNTLDQLFSNETMLAIAEGLQSRKTLQ